MTASHVEVSTLEERRLVQRVITLYFASIHKNRFSISQLDSNV